MGGTAHTAVRDLASRVGCTTTDQFNRGRNVLWRAGRRRTYSGTIPKVSPAALVDMARMQMAVRKLAATIDVNAAWESPGAGRLDAISFGECSTGRTRCQHPCACDRHQQGAVVAGKADDPAHRSEVLDTVAREFGGLDVLVNNAGPNPAYGPVVGSDLDVARKVLEVSVLATLAWVRDTVTHPELRFTEHRGTVVKLSSVTGDTPSPGIGRYGVSKAAVSHPTRALAVELGPGIRVNAVAPRW